MSTKAMALFDKALVGPAIVDSFRKLSPATQWRNPVMFVVYVGSILTTLLWVQALFGKGEAPAMFIFAITIWLWFTLLFANFAEALAEGRSKAQAASLRGVKTSVAAKKLSAPKARRVGQPGAGRRHAQGRLLPGRGQRGRAGRRRGRGRCRVGRRERHHRRVGAGHPRGGRRLLVGDRRHAPAVRLARREASRPTRARASSTG